MLRTTTSLNFSGCSVIDGVEIECYEASINTDNVEHMAFTSYYANQDFYKENREECRKDRAEFEDEAYSIQDQLLEKYGATEETETE